MRSLLPLVLFLAACPTVFAQATFQGLGFLDPDGFSDAFAVSADGSTVVGSASGHDGNPYSFVWTRTGGMVALPPLRNDGFTYSEALAVSANGAVVVGWDYNPGEGGLQGYHWSAATPGAIATIPYIDPLGHEYGISTGVSADGAIVVGVSGSLQAFRWTAADGTQALPLLPGGDSSEALGLSGDGSVIVGSANNAEGYHVAFRWTETVGSEEIPLPAGSSGSTAYAVSFDGATIVGEHYAHPDDGNASAFAWSAANGAITLDPLNFDYTLETHAHAVSGDGRWAVGHSGSVATLWDTQTGEVHDLYDLLTGAHGLDLTGWSLESATGISADGQTIVGYGFNPDGGYEGWVASLSAVPEPSTYALFFSATVLMWAAHRKRRPAPSAPLR